MTGSPREGWIRRTCSSALLTQGWALVVSKSQQVSACLCREGKPQVSPEQVSWSVYRDGSSELEHSGQAPRAGDWSLTPQFSTFSLLGDLRERDRHRHTHTQTHTKPSPGKTESASLPCLIAWKEKGHWDHLPRPKIWSISWLRTPCLKMGWNTGLKKTHQLQ